jgi:CrcB protein
MVQFLYVGLGGFLGCCLRQLIMRLIGEALPAFPLATLLSNAAAAFFIGVLIAIENHVIIIPKSVHLFLIVGLLGGLSTFSAFSAETVALIEKGKYLVAGGNVALNVAVCLGLVTLGVTLVKWMVTKG